MTRSHRWPQAAALAGALALAAGGALGPPLAAEEVRDVLGALPGDGPVEVLLKEALKLLAIDRAPRPALNGNGPRRA